MRSEPVALVLGSPQSLPAVLVDATFLVAGHLCVCLLRQWFGRPKNFFFIQTCAARKYCLLLSTKGCTRSVLPLEKELTPQLVRDASE